MAKLSKARAGSLQYWPRKRVSKILPRVNWDFIETLSSEKGFLGFISYKVGMSSALLKDETPNSLSKQKNIILPVTILECPPCKILSVRFYKDNKVVGEILGDNLEKELKRKIKFKRIKNPDKIETIIDEKYQKKEFDNIRLIVYTIVSKTGIKKTPDIIEIGLGGGIEEKISFVKENANKEISVMQFFKPEQLIDVKGLTKGKGIQGPVKRFGISLRDHKSEKGVRKPGSIGPWHPAHLTFRVPFAGQLGYFHRTVNNLKIIDCESIEKKDINPKEGFRDYGKIKTNYLILTGSIPGSKKSQLLITIPGRKTKKQLKRKYKLISIR